MEAEVGLLSYPSYWMNQKGLGMKPQIPISEVSQAWYPWRLGKASEKRWKGTKKTKKIKAEIMHHFPYESHSWLGTQWKEPNQKKDKVPRPRHEITRADLDFKLAIWLIFLTFWYKFSFHVLHSWKLYPKKRPALSGMWFMNLWSS